MGIIKDVVKDWLLENGYGGLYSDYECGCSTDDLFPCGECCGDCEPAYRIDNPDCINCDHKCEGYEDGVNAPYCLTREKPTPSHKESPATGVEQTQPAIHRDGSDLRCGPPMFDGPDPLAGGAGGSDEQQAGA